MDVSRIERGTLITTVRPVHSCLALAYLQVGGHGDLRLVMPLRVPSEIFARDLPWVLGICAVLFPLMWTGRRLARGEGALLAKTPR